MPRPQNSEVEAFLQRVASLPADAPGSSLDGVLKPAIEIEHELRYLFANEQSHERLADPHVGLVDVFDAPGTIRTTHARIVQNDEDRSKHYIMPLIWSRRLEGPCMLDELADFEKNWNIFTQGSLSRLSDWNNVVAAGGAVMACLQPLPPAIKELSYDSPVKLRYERKYPSADIDLFLWGLSLEETVGKIKQIYEAVREAIPLEVKLTCVRTRNTVSIHSQYPYRPVQIILRQYSSPAQVVVGFDVDSCCCLYDGSRVYASPRAIVAMMRQANTIDPSLCSSSYELRLAKYTTRDFEIYYPNLRRDDVDPKIYERHDANLEGLARLLVFEQIPQHTRSAALDSRVSKAEPASAEMSEYDVSSLHIPYGRGWDADKINIRIHQTDLRMNSTLDPKYKGLHRHPAFFGTVEECMEDCCGTCPEALDEDQRKVQEENDRHHIRGRISFIPSHFGRTYLPGSVPSVNETEWIAQAYITPTDKFFTAIAAHDRVAVSNLLREIGLNCRDCVGRTPLHLAILSSAPDIACDFVHAGARITTQMVDGRNSLHLAAQLDQLEVVHTLLERSAVNQETSKGTTDQKTPCKDGVGVSSRRSSQDDSSEEDGEVLTEAAESHHPILPSSDDEAAPDVLDVNGIDHDLHFTPLCYAILFSSPPVVEALLNAGASVDSVLTNDRPAVLPLALTLFIEDEDCACRIAEKLISAGASSSAADEQGTIFHQAVAANKIGLVTTFLRCDSSGIKALEQDHGGLGAKFDEAASVSVARQGTAAHSNVLSATALVDEQSSEASSLVKAVYDNDLEAFVNIANLYRHSSPRIELDADPSLLAAIFAKDRPEILDEYIRRTGIGIGIPAAAGTEALLVVPEDPKNDRYPGLSFHGRKRPDLARENDPVIVPVVEELTLPLLWQAASAGACEIVKYLAGDRPLSAYRFYSLSNSDERALGLRQVEHLEQLLPRWLGWVITPLGETPLFAGIESKSLGVIRTLVSDPSPFPLRELMLAERVKGLGVNALMFAIYLNCDTELVNFLLKRFVSPVVLDETNGFNIFHYMCDKDHIELLKHSLHKLPLDHVKLLLAQQTKDLHQTALHIAVQRGHIDAVCAMLKFLTAWNVIGDFLHVRDANGSTALHVAVQASFPDIVGHLIDVAPAGLGMENGGGRTPLEMAVLQDLIVRTRANQCPPSRGGTEGDVPVLREMLARRLEEGVLRADSLLGKQLFALADKLEAKHAVQLDGNADDIPQPFCKPACADPLRTLRIVRAGMVRHGPISRQLVHRTQVEASFSARINTNSEEENVRGGVDAQALRGSLVYRRMHMANGQ
ncbi:Ankyrin repeat protein [Mycena sanguinolenta]|uniref:Ankyrin repeat protein n=1 Tax=Mycena sanguinolenta TaxID=230812 RepID=A0A8H6XAK6_9AGAR|nr:Ankyrin repeat protein [Mycena sanguinolenta]